MRYLEVLRHPVVARLSLIQLISYFGTWFSQVAIFSMLASSGADEKSIAYVAAVNLLPAVLLAPFIGILVDRIPFKKLAMILLAVEIATTLGFLTIRLPQGLGLLMLLIFLRSSAASALFTAEMSLLPKLLESSALQRSNEIHSIIWSFTYASGMAIGGWVTYGIGAKGAFIVDALFYTIALLILSRLRLQLSSTQIQLPILRMIKEGIDYLRRRRDLVWLILLHASVGLTSFDALVTLLAQHRYREFIAIPLAIGAMNAVRAVGLSIGPFLIARAIDTRRLFYLLLAEGSAIVLWALLQQRFYLSLVALFLVGIFTTTLWSYTYLLIQERCDKEMLGRVISYNDMIFMLSNITTALFIGHAYAWGFSLQTITLLLGVGFFVTALVYLYIKQHHL